MAGDENYQDNNQDKKRIENLNNKNIEGTEAKNTFLDMESEINNMLKSVEEALGKTTLLFFRLGITHPEINREIYALREDFDKNKENASREFISNYLWKIISLLSKYVDSEENKIIKKLEEVLLKVQEIRALYKKGQKGVGVVIENFDDGMLDNMKNFTSGIAMIQGKEPPKNEINTGTPFRYDIYDSAA